MFLIVFALFADTIRSSGAKVREFILIDRQQFGPAANVHIDRQHQIINSAKVVINSTNSSLGHWRQDVSWIGNNLSLGGKASFEIMIRCSDPVIE